MLWTTARLQWMILRRDRLVWFLLAMFVGLLLYSGARGVSHTEERGALQVAAERAEAERLGALAEELTRNPPPPPKVITTTAWRPEAGAPAPEADSPEPEADAPASRESDPYLVGNELGRRVAALPLGALAPLTQGDARPTLFEVNLGAELASPEQAARPIALGRVSLGTMDMAFVLLYLLPLLVIALTYDLLLGERESKTLALVFSQPIAPMTFVLGKLLARAGLIAAATLVPALLIWLIAAPGDARGLFAVVTGLVVVLSYLAFWLAAAVAANAWMRSSAASALALMGLWLATLVLIPGLLQLGVEALYPPPSRVALVNLTRQAARDAEDALTAMEGTHGETPTEREAYRAFLLRKVKAHEHMESALEDVVDGFDRQLARQQGVVRWLQTLSPAVVGREAFAELSGDSVYRHQRFKRQAHRFHEAWRDRFFQIITRGERMTAERVRALPAFAYEAEPLPAQIGRIGTGIALGVWLPTVLLVLVSVRRVGRIGRL